MKEFILLTKEFHMTVAISRTEFLDCGCPHCGSASGARFINTYTEEHALTASAWRCDKCRGVCLVLADGVTVSPIALGGENYPELVPHPRKDIPTHGRIPIFVE